MFGLVIADIGALKEEDRKIYNAFYCGLCQTLGKDFNLRGRLTLNYDMTFLFLFLTSYFNEPIIKTQFRCGVHPSKQKIAYMNKYAQYSACMNILLTYYKLEDDWADDKNLSANMGKRLLFSLKEKAEKQFPNKAERIQDCLMRLYRVEKNDEHNPDIPSKIFGELMGELFDINNNEPKLFDFGSALGKVIYIMDACIDFKSDIKKCKYNPLIETETKNFQQILTILLGDCTRIYDTMNIVNNKAIIDNILFSGIWYQFRRKEN